MRNRKHLGVAGAGRAAIAVVLRESLRGARTLNSSVAFAIPGPSDHPGITGRTSVSCGWNIGNVEKRLGKRKFEYDLAFVVSHFEDCIQEAALGALGLQQFADH